MPTAVAPKKPTLLQRVQMYVLKKGAQAVRRGHPRRAAFWAGAFSGLGGLRSN